jgi:hypothetical protein
MPVAQIAPELLSRSGVLRASSAGTQRTARPLPPPARRARLLKPRGAAPEAGRASHSRATRGRVSQNHRARAGNALPWDRLNRDSREKRRCPNNAARLELKPEPAPVSRNASEAFRDSLPAVAAARAPGGDTATVFVALTDDAALREAIDSGVAGRGSVVTTATPQAFADQLVTHAGCVAILDLACVPTSAPIFIERLRGQFPGLVLVTAGTAREQGALAPLVADGTVCRFAHKPVSGQRLACSSTRRCAAATRWPTNRAKCCSRRCAPRARTHRRSPCSSCCWPRRRPPRCGCCAAPRRR